MKTFRIVIEVFALKYRSHLTKPSIPYNLSLSEIVSLHPGIS